ncbi:MAG: 1,4-dihydroxy-2-naphthoate octaprenyltransferase [candidate division Zixibacteria bacterium]|nr:1,4-dihydroxy-2-naphthoate octaprenyltransferase [candidate division Zixibacteria bacterium]
MNKCLIAIRAPFLTASALPVVIGVTLAVYETGSLSWFTAILTLISAVCLQVGTNVLNDYYDHKTTDDDINETPTPFSGGSRVIQDGLFSPRSVFILGSVFFIIGIIVGLYLWSITPGNTVLYLGLIGFLSGFLYTATPFKLGYRGIGELLVGLNFGVLEVFGAYFVQTHHFSWSTVFAGVPMSLLIAAVLYINQFPDYDADKAVGKKHWVVRLGKEKARVYYYLMVFASYLVVISSVIINVLNPLVLIVMITLPMAIKASKVLSINYNKIDELLPANALTIQIHMLFGLLLSVACIAGYFINI